MNGRRGVRIRVWKSVVAAGAAVALGVGMGASAAGAATSHTTLRLPARAHAPARPKVIGPATGKVLYARNEPVCPRPKHRDEARCFAVIRVPVSKGARGAVAYRLPRSVTLGPTGGYTPADLATAYGYNPSVNRKSQVIGIVDWNNDPNATKDLNAFDSHYGIPKETSTSFRVVNQSGGTKLPASNADTSVEEALDIESARSVCHTCRIVLVEANSGSFADTAAAENTAVRLGATEVSNSYGGTETQWPASILNSYNHPGVVITASTGDDGWYNWTVVNSQEGAPSLANFPATDPDVVAVGGTSLELKSSTGARSSETVWNNNGPDDLNYLEDGEGGGAGGGGCSQVYTAPAWQSHYAGYSSAGCNGKRLDSDVAAIADPETGFDVLDTFAVTTHGGWVTVGGTSLSSPVVAAMFALAGGSGGTVYPGSSLYVNGTARPAGHFDVKAGGNSFCGGDTTSNCETVTKEVNNSGRDNPNGLGIGLLDCSFPLNGRNVSKAPARNRQCNAVSGYDGPSGLGAPAGLSMFTPTSPKLSVTVPSAKVHQSGTYKVTVTERSSSTHVTGYAWTWGDGSSTNGTTATATHTYSKAGTYTATVTVSDSRYQATIDRFRVNVAS